METLPLPGTGQLDDNRGPEILGTCGALVGVSFLFLGIRFFVRVRMTKEVAWDDWFCLFSWVCRKDFPAMESSFSFAMQLTKNEDNGVY